MNKDSNIFGLIMDESIDVSVISHVRVFVISFEEEIPKTTFWICLKLMLV